MDIMYIDRVLQRDNKRRAVLGDPPLVRGTWYNGIPILIENEKGSIRKWGGHDEEKSFMHYDYGYIPDTVGMDGDEMDVYIGPDRASTSVCIIHQLKAPEFTEVDEWKIMLGFTTVDQAIEAYMTQYDQSSFYGDYTHISLELFITIILSDQPVYAQVVPLVLDPSNKYAKLIASGQPDTTNIVAPLLIVSQLDPEHERVVAKSDNTTQCEDDLEKKYEGFDKLKSKLKGKVSNPGAVAASIGRKKYGKKKFQRDAAQGKKMKNEKPLKKSKDATKLLKAVAKKARSGAKALANRAQDDTDNGVSKALTAAVTAGFSKRPMQAPVASESGFPANQPSLLTEMPGTPILKATPIDIDAVDVYKGCASCGRMHKSGATCTRCAERAELNKSVSLVEY